MIVLALFRGEDVNDQGPEIEKHPPGVGSALDVEKRFAGLSQLLVDVVGHGLDLPLRLGATDHEIVGKVACPADVKQDDVFGLFVGGDLNGQSGSFDRFQT